ncbi:MAG TPA: DUF5752 family protein [Thermodesulfobacteriota bacterium]|nr:DUF5752 family protein [Thermodesulfobacteriota bacterium]
MAPFRFYTSSSLTVVTGERALTVVDLLARLREAPESVIFHHAVNVLEERYYLTTRYASDFATWAAAHLDLPTLAEQLAAVDPRDYPTVAALKEAILRVLAAFVEAEPGAAYREARRPFFLCRAQRVVMATPYVATDLASFAEALRQVSPRSIGYHFIEARLTRGLAVNDFSAWLRTLPDGAALAQAVDRIDLYTNTLETIRAQILRLVEGKGGRA